MAGRIRMFVVGAALVLASTSMITAAQQDGVRAPAPGAPVPGARPAPVVRTVGKPRVTTPAQRASDRSRRRLLDAARHAPAPGLRRDRYLALMHAVWSQDLDANGDGTLTWRTGPESLGAKVGQCVVVEYTKQAAKKEKDPSKPGTWIETPEAWVPKDWLTWAEMLSTTNVQGECEVIGAGQEFKCMKPDMSGPLPPPPASGWDIKVPQQPCHNAWGVPESCNDGRAKCEGRGGVYRSFTTTNACEKYRLHGPDSEPAFLQVAAHNFDSEDLDHDGVIGAGEGQYLCMN